MGRAGHRRAQTVMEVVRECVEGGGGGDYGGSGSAGGRGGGVPVVVVVMRVCENTRGGRLGQLRKWENSK